MPRLFCLILLSAIVTGLVGGEVYTPRPLGSTPAPYGYLEYLPPGYQAKGKQKYPLLFFLHGLGELGDSDKDLPKVGNYGPLKHLRQNDQIGKLIAGQQAIVIAPQGLKADGWWRTEKLTGTLAAVIKQYQVDPNRIYVTGLSMGGGGTWAVATAVPDQVAAIVPICAAARVGDYQKLRGMPIWAHHAINDGVVKFPDNTQTWFEALVKDAGALPPGGVMTGYGRNDKNWLATLTPKGWLWQENVTVPTPGPKGALPPLLLSVYPDGSHDSWSRTYENQAVWEWLFKQSRDKRATVATK
jgi:dienelactone hydrolase